jgi:opacity protein-like surface antigen
MGSAKAILVTGALSLLSFTAANAADLAPIMPMRAPVVQEFSGWYLRGDVGMTNQKVKNLDNTLYSTFDSVSNTQKDFDSGWLFGLGVGYQFNSWLRGDLTGEYRGGTTFHGLDLVTSGGNQLDDNYWAKKSEWLMLANLYVDLGTWYGLTPFVGAGVGVSRITIADFKDIGVVNGGGGYADSASKWNFAWAAHAGVAYRVSPNFTVELAYRYVDLGNGTTGDIIQYNGVNQWYNPMEFKHITSHDVKLGVRWMLDQPEPAYAPLMRKG